MEKKINFNILSFLIISLFPFFLITGPFLSDLFCILLGLIFIIYNFKNKNWFELINIYKIYFYFFLIFYLYININSLFSFNPKISFSSSLPFIRIILFIFALSFFIFNYKKTYKGFYIIFFLSICFLFIDSISQFFFEKSIFGNKQLVSNRISSFFGDELIMGSYVSRLLPIVLGCSFLINIKNKHFFNFVILLISGILIMLSGERLAAFYYFGLFVIYFLLTKKYFFKYIILLSFSFFIFIFYNPIIIERFYKNTLMQFSERNSVFSYRHTLHYKTAYDMFLDKKILGHGIKSFRYKCSDKRYENKIKNKQDLDNKRKDSTNANYVREFKNGCNTHPHNIYFEFLSELGIIGFVFIIIIFSYIIFKLIYFSFKNIFTKKFNEIEVGKSLILTGIFLQLFPLVPSGSYFNNWMMIIFHLSIGFYLSSLKLK